MIKMWEFLGMTGRDRVFGGHLLLYPAICCASHRTMPVLAQLFAGQGCELGWSTGMGINLAKTFTVLNPDP